MRVERWSQGRGQIFCKLCGLESDGLGHSVEQTERFLGKRSGARARQDDAGKIQRIGWGDYHFLACFSGAAQVPQQVQSLRPRELFSDEARNKSASPNFTSRLHAAIDL
jgi:hypothetical protein